MICSKMQTVSWEQSQKKITNFNEQITSNNKYKSKIFAPNDGFCVYYPSNIFAMH